MNSEKKRSVSVDDLLRLKRLERPAKEFWLDFDRQLRAKQLSALVGRRPWWQDFTVSGMMAGFRRYQVPLGAAAIVALTFVSMRISQDEVPFVMASTGEYIAVQAPVPSVSSVSIKTEGSAVAAGSERTTAVVAAAPIADVSTVSKPVSDEPATRGFSHFVSLLGEPAAEGLEGSMASLDHFSESALEADAYSESVGSRSLLSTSSRFESRATPVRATVEPLQQITPPHERRGHRILTAMVSMASVESAMRTTERAASRLSEEQLYDQIHRFGARGAGVNVKF